MTGESLALKVQAWLEKHGYPLEMDVAQAFRKHRFYVEQSGYYIDQDSQKPREIDVIARLSKNVEDVHSSVACFIECKHSPGKPWILFTTERNMPEAKSDYFRHFTSPAGMRVFGDFFRKRMDELPRAIRPRNRLAYGVTQGLREKSDNQDTAYAAVLSATKAAAASQPVIKELSEEMAILHLSLPVVVINAPLFEYFIDENGERTLRQVWSGDFVMSMPVGGRNYSNIVRILTLEGVPEFVSDVLALSDFMAGQALEKKGVLLGAVRKHSE